MSLPLSISQRRATLPLPPATMSLLSGENATQKAARSSLNRLISPSARGSPAWPSLSLSAGGLDRPAHRRKAVRTRRAARYIDGHGDRRLCALLRGGARAQRPFDRLG